MSVGSFRTPDDDNARQHLHIAPLPAWLVGLGNVHEPPPTPHPARMRFQAAQGGLKPRPCKMFFSPPGAADEAQERYWWQRRGGLALLRVGADGRGRRGASGPSERKCSGQVLVDSEIGSQLAVWASKAMGDRYPNFECKRERL